MQVKFLFMVFFCGQNNYIYLLILILRLTVLRMLLLQGGVLDFAKNTVVSHLRCLY